METVSVKDKVDIASTFLLASPPGELNDVFNDIRTIINDDEALQKGIVSTLEQYNTEQHTTVTPPGLDYPVIISKHNQTQDGRFLDPRSNQTFSYHHMHLTAEDLQPADTEESALEPLRKALDEQAQAYVKDHFPEGVLTVVVENDQVALTLVDNKYNPNNFWNGRWLASWVYHTQSGELKGHTHVHVHYYEDGNVQLKASKDTEASLSKEDNVEKWASKIVDQISTLDKRYQMAMNQSYQDLADETFKGLRRALPLTRNKLDWNQILNYKIGNELAQK